MVSKSLKKCFSKSINMYRYFSVTPEIKKDSLENEISSYYGKASHYENTWGDDNLHLGYFPHLDDPLQPELTWEEATQNLTKLMGQKAKLTSNSIVVDFGCGTGGGTVDLVRLFNCKVTGMDLTPENIEKCQKRQERFNIPTNKLDWAVGSFTDLPDIIGNNKYDVVFSQLAIYHVAQHFSDVCKQAYKVLNKDGIFINSDFSCAETEISHECKEHFYKRLRIPSLISPSQFCQILTENGFYIDEYIQMDHQASFGYKKVRDNAKKHAIKSEIDGADLSKNYDITSQLFAKHEIGLNLVVARKK